MHLCLLPLPTPSAVVNGLAGLPQTSCRDVRNEDDIGGGSCTLFAALARVYLTTSNRRALARSRFGECGRSPGVQGRGAPPRGVSLTPAAQSSAAPRPDIRYVSLSPSVTVETRPSTVPLHLSFMYSSRNKQPEFALGIAAANVIVVHIILANVVKGNLRENVMVACIIVCTESLLQVSAAHSNHVHHNDVVFLPRVSDDAGGRRVSSKISCIHRPCIPACPIFTSLNPLIGLMSFSVAYVQCTPINPLSEQLSIYRMFQQKRAEMKLGIEAAPHERFEIGRPMTGAWFAYRPQGGSVVRTLPQHVRVQTTDATRMGYLNRRGSISHVTLALRSAAVAFLELFNVADHTFRISIRFVVRLLFPVSFPHPFTVTHCTEYHLSVPKRDLGGSLTREPMRVKRGEHGAEPERKGRGKTGDPRENPRFPRANIRQGNRTQFALVLVCWLHERSYSDARIAEPGTSTCCPQSLSCLPLLFSSCPHLATPQKSLQGVRKQKIPEKKNRQPAASSGTIPKRENPGVTRPGIEPRFTLVGSEQSNRSATAASESHQQQRRQRHGRTDGRAGSCAGVCSEQRVTVEWYSVPIPIADSELDTQLVVLLSPDARRDADACIAAIAGLSGAMVTPYKEKGPDGRAQQQRQSGEGRGKSMRQSRRKIYATVAEEKKMYGTLTGLGLEKVVCGPMKEHATRGPCISNMENETLPKIPEVNPKGRLTTTGHTHLHVFLVHCPDDKRRRSQCYVGLYRARLLAGGGVFCNCLSQASATTHEMPRCQVVKSNLQKSDTFHSDSHMLTLRRSLPEWKYRIKSLEIGSLQLVARVSIFRVVLCWLYPRVVSAGHTAQTADTETTTSRVLMGFTTACPDTGGGDFSRTAHSKNHSPSQTADTETTTSRVLMGFTTACPDTGGGDFSRTAHSKNHSPSQTADTETTTSRVLMGFTTACPDTGGGDFCGNETQCSQLETRKVHGVNKCLFADHIRIQTAALTQERVHRKRDIPEKTRQPVAPSCMIPTYEDPRATPLGIEPDPLSPETSALTAAPPRPPACLKTNPRIIQDSTHSAIAAGRDTVWDQRMNLYEAGQQCAHEAKPSFICPSDPTRASTFGQDEEKVIINTWRSLAATSLRRDVREAAKDFIESLRPRNVEVCISETVGHVPDIRWIPTPLQHGDSSYAGSMANRHTARSRSVREKAVKKDGLIMTSAEVTRTWFKVYYVNGCPCPADFRLPVHPFVSSEYVYVDALGRPDIFFTLSAPLHSIIWDYMERYVDGTEVWFAATMKPGYRNCCVVTSQWRICVDVWWCVGVFQSPAMWWWLVVLAMLPSTCPRHFPPPWGGPTFLRDSVERVPDHAKPLMRGTHRSALTLLQNAFGTRRLPLREAVESLPMSARRR
ncbi:hypothetical protein PR048_019062 [Dryococelus australis]|uniref:Uncharacterized protein n=1 Tax=Dryococelus australis TaxID=614101 RepID=A0ABQ9H2K3_9NEOP|nr:hypothetical protein PR048_019062 [Dryococelus australis]